MSDIHMSVNIISFTTNLESSVNMSIDCCLTKCDAVMLFFFLPQVKQKQHYGKVSHAKVKARWLCNGVRRFCWHENCTSLFKGVM